MASCSNSLAACTLSGASHSQAMSRKSLRASSSSAPSISTSRLASGLRVHGSLLVLVAFKVTLSPTQAVASWSLSSTEIVPVIDNLSASPVELA